MKEDGGETGERDRGGSEGVVLGVLGVVSR